MTNEFLHVLLYLWTELFVVADEQLQQVTNKSKQLRHQSSQKQINTRRYTQSRIIDAYITNIINRPSLHMLIFSNFTVGS